MKLKGKLILKFKVNHQSSYHTYVFPGHKKQKEIAPTLIYQRRKEWCEILNNFSFLPHTFFHICEHCLLVTYLSHCTSVQHCSVKYIEA